MGHKICMVLLITVTDEFKVVESETWDLYHGLGPSGKDWFSGVKFESL